MDRSAGPRCSKNRLLEIRYDEFSVPRLAATAPTHKYKSAIFLIRSLAAAIAVRLRALPRRGTNGIRGIWLISKRSETVPRNEEKFFSEVVR